MWCDACIINPSSIKPKTKHRRQTMTVNSVNTAQTAATAAQDTDKLETREWMDALSAVIEAEGPERAHYLLEQLLEHARQSSIDMPFSANTAYVNTIRTRTRSTLPR
jgi:pyruvate dehydrogenase E1 component